MNNFPLFSKMYEWLEKTYFYYVFVSFTLQNWNRLGYGGYNQMDEDFQLESGMWTKRTMLLAHYEFLTGIYLKPV